MSILTTDQGNLHYEVYGRGQPVILLHGWLGSWGLWQDTMTTLGQSYRTYALDFWGFGEFGKQNRAYHVQDYVRLVDQFMQQLGIENAPLVGHSMGGTVSLAAALQFPQRVNRVVVIGSPICGSSLSWLLKLFGKSWIAWVVHKNLWGLKLGFRLLAPLYCRDPNWYSMMARDISYTTLESFRTSIATLRKTDLRPQLAQLSVPVMGMYGDKDIVVRPDQWKPIQQSLPSARIERFPQAGHFIMLDDPQRFQSTLLDFLGSSARREIAPFALQETRPGLPVSQETWAAQHA